MARAGELQVIDWPTKVPVSPRWTVDRFFMLRHEIPAGNRRVIVGGFSSALVAYDLETMQAPTTERVEDLVALAELAAGRRILSHGHVILLNSSEWVERWDKVRRKGIAPDAARKESQARQNK
jgi:hypothetical protein